MRIATRIIQGILAAVFLTSGWTRSTLVKARILETGQAGGRDYPLGLIRFIAACELLGAVGLLLPRRCTSGRC
jgi:hypothetical protein